MDASLINQMFVKLKPRWKMLNALLLLTAFVAPWLRACSNDDSTLTNGLGITTLAATFAVKSSWADPLIPIMYFAIFVGLVALLFYTLIYSLLHFRPNSSRHLRIRICMLCAGVSAVLLVRLITLKDHTEMLWGYWFMWVALVFSIVFEIVNFLQRNTTKQARDSLVEKVQPRLPKKRRLLTAILFFVAFMLPWQIGVSYVVGSFDSTGFGVISRTIKSLPMMSHTYDWLAFLVFLCLCGILLYAILYALLNFRPENVHHARIRIVLLCAGMLGLSGFVIGNNLFSISKFLLGYWFAWVGLILSLRYEIETR